MPVPAASDRARLVDGVEVLLDDAAPASVENDRYATSDGQTLAIDTRLVREVIDGFMGPTHEVTGCSSCCGGAAAIDAMQTRALAHRCDCSNTREQLLHPAAADDVVVARRDRASSLNIGGKSDQRHPRVLDGPAR